MRTLIANGTVVTAGDATPADVLVEGETVSLVGKDLARIAGKVDRTIDAKGKYVLPGGIDVHTHLDMPFGGTTSADDFETGTIAAACGGTTTVVDFAIQPPGGTLAAGLAQWHGKAEGKAAIDYGFHMIVRQVTPDTLAEMDRLLKHEGVSSFKLFTAYPGVFMVDDASIFKALRKTGESGGLVCMHAENGGVIDALVAQALAAGHGEPVWHARTRPARLEGEATGRVIALAEVAHAPIYIVHLSAAEALAEVREARNRGLPVYAETCPQYLFLSHENYEEPGFDGAKYVMSPPLRAKGNETGLWQGLRQDDIQLVSTDHCPFNMKQKELGRGDFSKIPNGAPGIETRLLLLWDAVRRKELAVSRFVQLTATAPAKLFGLYPKKGTVAPGSDADILVWDPAIRLTLSAKGLHMNVDYNPFEGKKLQGAPQAVLSRGEVVYEDGRFTGKKGRGKFLRRTAREE